MRAVSGDNNIKKREREKEKNEVQIINCSTTQLGEGWRSTPPTSSFFIACLLVKKIANTM